MDTKIKILDELSLSNVIDKEAELIPLMTEEDEERLMQKKCQIHWQFYH